MRNVQPQPATPLGAPAGQSPEKATAAGAPAAGGSSPQPVVEITGLIVAHHAALYRYAFRLTGRAADAEDLTQQAFLIAQQKLHQLREADRAAGWLYAILRSCYLKWRRKRFPISATLAELDLGEVAEPTGKISAVDSEELQKLLGELSEDLRLILVMFYFEELSYKQIAEELEIPIGTVMSRLSRAKHRLRERLAAQEISPTQRPNPRRVAGVH